MDKVKKKVAFHTLGCKLNFAETSTIARSFPDDDYERVTATQKADIYVINTCTVTGAADKKCRQVIKKFINQSPNAYIIVAGCYAQLNPEEISKIEGVDLILGVHDKFNAAQYLGDLEKKGKAAIYSCDIASEGGFDLSHSAGDRTRSFLKVQDGCDYVCSYCTIPMARGCSRNPASSVLVEELRKIASDGVKEVVLTGVNIGDYGKSDGDSFYNLLKQLLSAGTGIRLRISSIEPNLITDEIIALAAENQQIANHFHIPLQSGSNTVLGLMRRRYIRELFRDKVERILSAIPSAGIGADVIVGFPGEGEKEFSETYSFLESLPLSYLHVFPFSERPGTPAEKLNGKVPLHVREERSKLLQTLSQKLHTDFLYKNTGREENVVFEAVKSNGMVAGFTGNYIRVEHPWRASLAGTIKKVKLTEVTAEGKMITEIIG